MAKTVKLIGTITTLAPVSVALPNVKGMPRNSHKAAYIPATSVRGLLRHTAHFALAQLLEKSEQYFTVDEHYMLASGVDTGRKLKLGGGYETIGKNAKVRENNPLISLFGNFTVAGRLKVGNATSAPGEDNVVTLGNGARNHPFNRNTQLIGFVPEEQLSYLQNVMNADALASLEVGEIKAEVDRLKKENKSATPEEKKENLKLIDELNDQIRQTKDARVGATEAILRPLDGFEAIDEGVTLSHRMTLTNPTEDELNFLLWTLQKASADFNIGGHQNLGCGDIAAEWKIVETSFENPEPKELGTLRIDEDGFNLTGMNFDYAGFEKSILEGKFKFQVY